MLLAELFCTLGAFHRRPLSIDQARALLYRMVCYQASKLFV